MGYINKHLGTHSTHDHPLSIDLLAWLMTRNLDQGIIIYQHSFSQITKYIQVWISDIYITELVKRQSFHRAKLL